MGTEIKDIVVVTITRESARITRRGFGIPIVVGIHTRFPELVRSYSSIEDVEEDFQSGDEELKAATALFSQSIKPESILIGRREANKAQRLTVSVDTVVDDTDYTVTINGTPFVHNSGVAASAISIAAGLVALIDAGAEPVDAVDNLDGTFYIVADVTGEAYTLVVDTNMSINQTSVVTVDTAVDETTYTVTINDVPFTFLSGVATTDILIAAGLVAAINGGSEPVTATDNLDGTFDLDNDVAGNTFSTRVDFNMSLSGDTTNVNIGTELSDIQKADDTWYGIILTRRSTEAEQIQDIEDTAEWAETRLKLYGAAIDQASMITSAIDDIGSFLKSQGYDRTYIMYSTDEENYPEAAWFGLQLPKDPGSTTWKFKQLTGISVDELTSNQIINLKSKNINFFENVAGVNIISSEAIVASGEFIDIIRGVDWLQAQIEENVFAELVKVEKIPYTNAGISVIENVLRAELLDAVDVGLLTENTIVVTVPLAENIDEADKTARLLKDIEFTAQLAGAVHKVEINGKLSV
jgi:hypothetical protein